MTISSWLLTTMIIFGELYEPFKNLLKETFGHHWIGKAAIITIVFFGSAFLFRKRDFEAEEKLAWKSVLWSLAIIFAFFIIHYFVS